MSKITETRTFNEIIEEIAQVLRESDGDYLASIANQILSAHVTYEENGQFTVERKK